MFKWIEGMQCSLLKSRALLYSEDLHFLPNLLFFGDVSVILSPLVTEGCTKEDPLSQESFRKLALPLPYSKKHHSKLVCYISKELMDTENPQVFPNGYVYSTKALKEMADKSGVSTDLVEVCSVALRMNQLISYHLSSKSKPL
ncbi:hypothetical protein DY000_02061399 [Brassica cretica]|uniref:RING-Gid-type domain-containing protein n=1 Tax=Brassica cretica TaxID=69181 RepID=A0ABQ7AR18_BRACR|nr:hypothetical protein DY000_02061399 [Brassica cretica]